MFFSFFLMDSVALKEPKAAETQDTSVIRALGRRYRPRGEAGGEPLFINILSCALTAGIIVDLFCSPSSRRGSVRLAGFGLCDLPGVHCTSIARPFISVKTIRMTLNQRPRGGESYTSAARLSSSSARTSRSCSHDS